MMRVLGIRLGCLDEAVGDWPVDAAFNGRTGEVIGSKADVPEMTTSAGVELGFLAASRDFDREVASRVGQFATARIIRNYAPVAPSRPAFETRHSAKDHGGHDCGARFRAVGIPLSRRHGFVARNTYPNRRAGAASMLSRVIHALHFESSV